MSGGTWKLLVGTIIFPIFMVVGTSLLVKLILHLRTKRCKSLNKMHGKTVIITGGNSGIGYETAIDLAARGARVILACRNEKKAEKARGTIHFDKGKARDNIIKKTKNQNVVYKIVDLSDLDSVRRFCSEIHTYENRLDILINNAGAVFLHRRESAQGYELTLATNHHGHFLMTILLIDLLKKCSPSRIINVSSALHYRNHFDISDLHFQKRLYSLVKANCQSKLCNILFTKELSQRLTSTGVTVNALDPGATATGLLDKEGSVLGKIMKLSTVITYKSPELGAQTTIHLAVADEVETISGEYFENCEISKCSKQASDRELARMLWQISEEETKL